MVTRKFVDCTLTINDLNSINIVYYDEEGTKCSERGSLGSDSIAQLTVKRLNEWVNFGLKQEASPGRDNPLTVDDLKIIGLMLYGILFHDENIKNLFNEVYRRFDLDYRTEAAKGDNSLRLRLRLVFRQPLAQLDRLPWEFLFIPDPNKPEDGFFFTGAKTELILTRYVPQSELVKRLGDAAPGILKILVAVSRPTGLGSIPNEDIDKVIAQMREIKKAQVRVLKDGECTAKRLYEELQDFTPHIFHFIGHGEAGKLAFVMDPKDPNYRETEEFQRQWVTSKDLEQLFVKCNPKPRLVFLHACKGAASDSLEAFNSCALELVRSDIPAVVAMQYNISVDDAGLFAKTFYEELGQGCDVDEAVRAGREALGTLVHPFYQHPRFGTPVVYLQTDKPIVIPQIEEAEAEEQPSEETTTSIVGGTSRVAPTTTTTTQRPERSAPVAAVRQEHEKTTFGGKTS